MDDPIELIEHATWSGQLADEDVVFIASEMSRPAPLLSVQREVRGTGYHLVAHHYVGTLTLPSGRQLCVRPKVPLGTLFFMLAVAYDLPLRFRDEPAALERIEDVVEIIAAYFADLVHARIDRGLYRHYVEREENLTTVRGRIDIVEDSRRNALLRLHIYCRFEELTWDIPENQVIKQALHLLGGWSFRARTRQRLQRLEARMGEITLSDFSPRVFDQFQYHRLNEDYQPLHRLCHLFLEGASLSERLGRHSMMAFFVDMNRLFETFIARVLDAHRPLGLSIAMQESMLLDHEGAVTVRPDLVIRRGSRVLAVADCKYKRLGEGEIGSNDDIYQLLAYCTRLGALTGFLIYPHVASLHVGSIAIRNTSVKIHAIGMDLGSQRELLVRACEQFSARVFSMATSAPESS